MVIGMITIPFFRILHIYRKSHLNFSWLTGAEKPQVNFNIFYNCMNVIYLIAAERIEYGILGATKCDKSE